MQQRARLVGRLVRFTSRFSDFPRNKSRLIHSSPLRASEHNNVGEQPSFPGFRNDSGDGSRGAAFTPHPQSEDHQASEAEDGSALEGADSNRDDTVDEESELSEYEAGAASNSAQFEFGEHFARAQAQQVLLLTEGTSDSEQEKEEVQKRPDSYLHKLTIREVAKVLRKLRAIDLKILNVEARCHWADYMVFATGKSTRHIRGMADRIVQAVKKKSTQDNHLLFPTVEGRDCENWMVVDCGDIVVHVFSEDSRARYNLEWKWSGEDIVEMSFEDIKKQEAAASSTPAQSTTSTGAKKKKLTTKKKRLRAARNTTREIQLAAKAAKDAYAAPA